MTDAFTEKKQMEREILAFEDDLGNGVQFTIKESGIYVHCHSDFCGDTETGFGAEVGFDMTFEQAMKLYLFLQDGLTHGSP